ncbi:MAG: Eco57I restriction-modification methylase domain-containing protein [Saprospiraceae bacterium]|nr:Eco57I restriction-modification methylase domain-containing protein [Candidatus Defluviibacterium haderslevense]
MYIHFVNSAQEINPRIINLIMPTRWYAGSKGLDDFRKTNVR